MSSTSSIERAQRRRPMIIGMPGFVVLGVAGLATAWLLVYPVFVMQIMCFAVFGAAFNLLLGHAGMLSLGHAAFFGVGAYVTGYLMKAGATPELALLGAVALATALGLSIGAVAIRRSGIHFAMITLALAQMVYFLAVQSPLTGGENGMQGIPRGELFGLVSLRGNGALYLFVSFVTLASLVALHRIATSPFGETLRAIRQHEDRAVSLGYPVERYRLGAFAISAAFAGLAGGMKALVLQLATLTDVSFFVSGEIVLICLLGGVSTFAGPLVGAALLIGFQLAFVSSAVPVPFVIGLTFIACVLLFPRGIVGELDALVRRPGRSASPRATRASRTDSFNDTIDP